ncbi:MAG: glycosyltransferase family 2 protein [Thermoproteota archaeon]
MLSAKPLISVIIPTFNSEKTIYQCINSLLQQDYERFEIIAIDGGSTDETIQILKKFNRVKIIHSDKNILGYMRQLGVDKSAGEIIAFIDSDIFLPHKFWLSSMINCLRRFMALDNHIVAVFSLWRYSRDEKLVRRYTTLYCNFILRKERVLKDDKLIKTSFWGTGQTLITRSAIEAVGGFNHNIHYYEDADLARRMVANGFIFILSTNRIDAVTHLYANSFTAYLKKFYKMSILGAMQFGGRIQIGKELASIPWSVICMVQEISRDRDPVWIIHPILQVTRAFLRSLALARYATR